MKMARKFVLLAVVASLSVLTACNTVKGLGRDIESVGEKGEDVIKG
jgi:predicted small secreted protein